MGKLKALGKPNLDEPEVSGELVHLEMELQLHREEANARLDSRLDSMRQAWRADMQADMQANFSDLRSMMMEEFKRYLNSLVQTYVTPAEGTVDSQAPSQHNARCGAQSSPVVRARSELEGSASSSTMARSEGLAPVLHHLRGNHTQLPNSMYTAVDKNVEVYGVSGVDGSLDVNVDSQVVVDERIRRGKFVHTDARLDCNAMSFTSNPAPSYYVQPLPTRNGGTNDEQQRGMGLKQPNPVPSSASSLGLVSGTDYVPGVMISGVDMLKDSGDFGKTSKSDEFRGSRVAALTSIRDKGGGLTTHSKPSPISGETLGLNNEISTVMLSENCGEDHFVADMTDKLSVGGNSMNACVGNRGPVIESTEAFVVEVKVNGRPSNGDGAHKLEGVSVKRYSLGLSSIEDRREYSTDESGKGILENDNKCVQHLSAPKLSISYSGLADTSNHRYLGLSFVTQGPPVVQQPLPTATSPTGTLNMVDQMSIHCGRAAPFSQYGSPSMFFMPPSGVTSGKSQLSTVQLVAGSLSKRLEKYIEELRKIRYYALQPCFSGFDKRVRDKGSGQPALTYGNLVLEKELTGNMRLLWCAGYIRCTLEAPNTMNVHQLLTFDMSVSVVEETSTSLGLLQHENHTYLVDGMKNVIFHLPLNEAAEVYKKSQVRRLDLNSTDVRRLVFLVCTAGMNLSDEVDWGAYHSDIQDIGLGVSIVGSLTGDEDVTGSTTLEQTKVIFAMLLMSSAMPNRPLSGAKAQMVDGNRLLVLEDFELINDAYHILERHEEHVHVSQFSQLLLDEENFSEHIIVYMQTAPSALHCFKPPIVNVTVLTIQPSFNPAWNLQVAHLGPSLPHSGYHGVNFVMELGVFQSYFLLVIIGSKRSVIVLVHLHNQDILTRPLFGVNSLQPLVEVVHPNIMNILYASALEILVILPVNLILPYVTIRNDHGDRYVSTPNSPKSHGDYSILVWSFNVAKREVRWNAVLSCYVQNKVHMGVSTAVEAGKTVVLVHDDGLMIMKADVADGDIRKSWILKPKHVTITLLQKKAERLAILKWNLQLAQARRKKRIYNRDFQNLKLEVKF